MDVSTPVSSPRGSWSDFVLVVDVNALVRVVFVAFAVALVYMFYAVTWWLTLQVEALLFRVYLRLVRFLLWSLWLAISVVHSPFWWFASVTVLRLTWFSGGLQQVSRGTDVDGAGQPRGEEANVAEARRVPVTAHLCARVRPRARWVKTLESVLGPVPGGSVGRLVRGSWTPDLPSSDRSAGANLVLSRFEGGTKLLGSGAVLGQVAQTETRVPYLVVEFPDGGVDVVFPELVSVLSSYSWLRAREQTLVLSLRSRAIEWAKKKGLSETHAFVAVSTAVKWAWHLSPSELSARGELVEEPAKPWWT